MAVRERERERDLRRVTADHFNSRPRIV
eukprot:COSAG03_NODE_23344_length_281_cov_0.357143_2_plen_27_part_01